MESITPVQQDQASAQPGAVKLDAEGFLVDWKQWSRSVAEALAKQAKVELTPEHWKILEFIRADYEATHASPGLRRITQHTGVSMKDLYRLFPNAPGKRAAMLAGTPKPKSCL